MAHQYVSNTNGLSLQDVCPDEVFAMDSSVTPDNSSQAGHDQSNKPHPCVLLVAKVLIGYYTEGKKDMRKPPNSYDCCVDDMNTPKRFIIFEKNQIYPAYIIEYT